jgi:N-acetylglucosamine-6-phosphate deacetylase
MLHPSELAPIEPFPLVDLQVNGGWGVDFSSPDATKADLRDCIEAWLDAGLAALLPTIVTSPGAIYERNLPLLAALTEEPSLRGRVLGIHLEGPFLPNDPRVLGAHRSVHLEPASTAQLDRIHVLSRGSLRMLTVAAEIPGVANLIRHARSLNVVVAIGHSYYTGDNLMRMAEVGATALTHVGNALPPQLDRHANPIIAALLADYLTAMFIADGHHLSVDLLRLLFRSRSINRLVAVSDAASIAGLPPGDYIVLNQRARLMKDGALRNLGENHLVGSSVGLRTCVDNLVRQGVCTPGDCAKVASANPLALLGLSRADLGPNGTMVTYNAEQGCFVIIGDYWSNADK